MQQYVALLRGINVGGHGVIKMADLRQLFESLGLSQVVTYIQSGNVLFRTGESRVSLTRRLEERLASATGNEIKVFVFTRRELERAAANNPFAPERMDAEQRCHLMFLSAEPDAAHREKLMALEGEEYRFHIDDRVLYYAYSRKYDGRRRTIDFERVLGVNGTARTWKVVDKLIELSA
jgi:uncharacterized protein (DUF1697 family)